jgi:hypothetical protein
MTIETKYNIGDTHWDIDGKIAKSRSVKEIRINVYDRGDATPEVDIRYLTDGSFIVSERNFLPTKQELLNSL